MKSSVRKWEPMQEKKPRSLTLQLFLISWRKYTLCKTGCKNWFGGEDKDVYTPYSTGRYSVYKDRLDAVTAKPLKRISDEIGMSRPAKLMDINHGKPSLINSSLDYIFGIYNKNIQARKLETTQSFELIADTIREWLFTNLSS